MKRRWSAALSLALLGLASPALAQDEPTETLASGPRDRSPQYAALELRFGRYVPNVDDNVDGTPFNDFFGDGNRYLFGFEVDWQALRVPHLGSLGLGLGWGYTRMGGKNRLPEGAPPAEVSQSSTLNIMPMYLVAVLRADVLMRRTGVPLVPYAKAGFGYALWWVNDGLGVARSNDGIKGSDASYGPQWSLGGMLLLDGLDASAAKTLDTEIGVNNTYLFGEWYNSSLGGDTRMEVGTSTWMVGFAIEM